MLLLLLSIKVMKHDNGTNVSVVQRNAFSKTPTIMIIIKGLFEKIGKFQLFWLHIYYSEEENNFT